MDIECFGNEKKHGSDEELKTWTINIPVVVVVVVGGFSRNKTSRIKKASRRIKTYKNYLTIHRQRASPL